MGAQVVAEVTITAENTFTTGVSIRHTADVSVAGVVDSAVTVQRSFDNGVIWKDIEQFTVDFERAIDASLEGVLYRVGVKTGDYGTDTIEARISQ